MGVSLEDDTVAYYTDLAVEGEQIMKKTKIALKPYLDTISGFCDTLSNEELKDIIISLAKDISTSARVGFLDKIESCLPGCKPVVMSDINVVEQILSNIEALRESIEERINTIEDGSYWDDPDCWEDDGYDDEDPDYISNDQDEELEAFFSDAEIFFLDDRLEDARKVYGSLFKLINEFKEDASFSPFDDIDIREARARYCRCVYETTNRDKRLDEFIKAMEIDASEQYNESEYNENYPLIQDVIDAKPGEMENLEQFLSAWIKALIAAGTKGRPAGLLLESVNRLEGINGVSRLARKWGNSQPLGYLFWLDVLKSENDQKDIIRVSVEGLTAIKQGEPRERVAEFMIHAARELNDSGHILFGTQERFFSLMNDRNLLALVSEASIQGKRDSVLDAVMKYFQAHKESRDEKELYTKTLLMAGDLNNAFALAKNKKGVGWSYGSNAGVVFGSVLTILSDYSETTGTIKKLLKAYANERFSFSEKYLINDDGTTSCYDEIIKGLKQNKETNAQTAEYLSWAENIGKNRIEHMRQWAMKPRL